MDKVDLQKNLEALEGNSGWAGNGLGTYWAARYCETIPEGLYIPYENNSQIFFTKSTAISDDLIRMPDTVCEELLDEFNVFWNSEEEFIKRGFVHKRGFLLYGPPGVGKTSILRILSEELIKKYQGIVLLLNSPGIASFALATLRRIEQKRPIMCLLEDFEAILARWSESEYLALLDGERQINNIIFVATTNYPDSLDKRFTARPGRFDTVRPVNAPSRAARKLYFNLKEPSLEGAELELWLKLSDGFSIAHMREMILGNRCLKRPIEEICKQLRTGMERVLKVEKTENKVGFAKNRYDDPTMV